MKKHTYFVENHPTITRTTHRTYTHAVIYDRADGTSEAATWCGRYDLALKELGKYQKYNYKNARIAPVHIKQ